MRLFSSILLAIILLIVFIFACLNAAPVAVHYYFGVGQWPLSLLLIMALILGGILGLLAAVKMLWRSKQKNQQLQRQLKQLKQQMSEE